MSEPRPPSFLGRIARLRDRIRWPWRLPVRPVEPDDLDRERLRGQIAVVREALGEEVVVAMDDRNRAEDDADFHFAYRPGRALVRQGADLEQLDTFLRGREDRYASGLDVERTTRDGLAVVVLPSRTDERDPVLATLDEVDNELREGMATPDHLLYVTKPRLCPAAEPEEPLATTPVPAPSSQSAAGGGVRVSVVDTGWWQPAGTSQTTPWLSGVDGDAEQVNPQQIHAYAGHGTFVSGVIRCVAPKTDIEVEGFLTQGGALYESEICEQLSEALDDREHKPQIISISAGTRTRAGARTREPMGLLSFEILAERHGLGEGGGILVVAAAGNDSSEEPFYPAAFPWVVGVGSLDPDGKVSDFSNVGHWVDVYARGRNLVNAFPVGIYTCREPENIHNGIPDVRKFNGLAQWSGTSFSTPIVTGLIAARMSVTGETASQAFQKIRNAAATSNDPRAGQIWTVGPLQ